MKSSVPISPAQAGVVNSNRDDKKTSGKKTRTESSREGRSPLPSNMDVENLSEQVPEMLNISAGEDTEELSDISDIEATMSLSLRTNRLTSLFHRLSPFIRNKKVRFMLIVNFFATIINMLLLVVLITFIIWTIILHTHIRSETGVKKFPCLFTYLEWSDCSSTCRESENRFPQRIRRVNISSIIQARNGGEPECPKNLANRIDSAPCNAYWCPTNLSNYNFSETCNYNDAGLRDAGGCFKIRDVPLDDRLIFIDTNLIESCNCANVRYI